MNKEMRNHRRMRILLILVLFVTCAIPSVILASEKVTDAYYSIITATAEESIREGRISSIEFGDFSYDPYEEGHLGYHAMIITLSEVLGISPSSLSFLPLGGFIIPFLFFALSMKLFKSYVVGGLLALFIAFDPSLMPGHYSVFAYTWERALFFVFIIIAIRYLQHPEKWQNSALLFIVFLGTFSLYWTTPFLMISFIFGITIVHIIKRGVSGNAIITGRITARIVTLSLITYLAFSRILYSYFLPKVAFERYGNLSSAFEQFLAWLSMGGSEKAQEYQLITSGVTAYDTILVTRYFVMILPIIIYVIWSSVRWLRNRRTEIDVQSYVLWAIIIVGMTQTIAYAALGHLSFRYVSLLFLPVAVIAMIKMNFRRMKLLTVSIVLILALSAFALLVGSPSSLNRTEGIGNSAIYIFQHSDTERYSIITDLNTFGTYLVEGVSISESHAVIIFYDSNTYGMVVNAGNSEQTAQLDAIADYVVININMRYGATAAPNWRHYEPLAGYLDDINMNSDLSTIFDDGCSWILKTQ